MYLLDLIASMTAAAKAGNVIMADRYYAEADQWLMSRYEHAMLMAIMSDLRQLAYFTQSSGEDLETIWESFE